MSNCWLHGKTVVVTGASGGMGAGIAATLIKKHGCTVIGIARNEQKMLNVISELGEENAKRFSYRLFDVSVRENWEKLAEELKESKTKIDILINNAGILPKFKRFDRYSYEEIENAMNINFYSAVYSVKTLLPMILESSTPAVINIDSSAALMTLAGTSIYSASKAALKAFTEALRTEFSGKMYVGLVCPGFTKTDIFRGQTGVTIDRGAKAIDLISTDCDIMVKKIMLGIELRMPMQIHGMDAHAMSIVNRMMPTRGSKLFSSVMRMAKIDLFKEVFFD